MKYIPADKLIAEIERLKEETPIGICEYDKGEENGRMAVITSLQSTIDSLQQEQPEFVNEIWHKVSEEANLTRPVVLSDGDKYMSPPCTFPFKDMSGFVNAMNKKYKADYTIWAYMDDILNISSLQQEQQDYKEAVQLVFEEELTPFKDGNQWCFLLGRNIQEGVCGFGDTILDAAVAFYKDYGRALTYSDLSLLVEKNYVKLKDLSKEEFVRRCKEIDERYEKNKQEIEKILAEW